MADAAPQTERRRPTPARPDVAGRRRAHRRARLRRDPDRRRGQAGRRQLRRWSSTTSAPRTSCSPRRCAFRRTLFYRRAERLARETVRPRPARLLVRLTCVPAGRRRDAAALGGSGSTCGRRPSATPRSRSTASSSTTVGATLFAAVVARGPGERRDRRRRRRRRFTLTFAALLDGLSIQVALEDPSVTPARAVELAMGYAARELGLDWSPPGPAAHVTRSPLTHRPEVGRPQIGILLVRFQHGRRFAGQHPSRVRWKRHGDR